MSDVHGEYGESCGAASTGSMSRKEFLRLAGFVGAGASIPGGFSLFGSGEARAAEILGGGRFPIGLWHPPPPEQTNVARYREISDAGFTFVIGGNGVGGDGTNPDALEAAAANDLHFILTDGELRRAIDGGSSSSRSFSSGSGSIGSPMRDLRLEEQSRAEESDGASDDANRTLDSSGSKADIRRRISELLESYGDSPALAGINVYDEPHARLFANIAHAKEAMRDLDRSLLPYVNVWPSSVPPEMLGARNYPTYISRYMSEVGPPVLSFDHYPLLAGGATTRDYFQNWEIIRRNALRAGVPSWVFIQSVDFDGRNVGLAPRRRPSRADILWQINVSLAYGAKGVQYFTYWTPDDARADYGQALISKSGGRTPLYDYARSANAYLSRVGEVLAPMRTEGVFFSGVRKPPPGTRKFRRDAFVSSAGGSPAILGWFRKPGAKVRFLLVVNRSPRARATTAIAMNPKVNGISRFIPKRRRFVTVRRRKKERGARKLRVALAPGAAQLVMLRRR